MTKNTNTLRNWVVAAARRFPIVSLLLAWFSFLLGFWPRAIEALAFRYDPFEPLHVWQTFTCHFVHWSWDHLLWDVGTFVCVGVGCEVLSRRRFLGCMAMCLVSIPAVVGLWGPDLTHYAGLSGIDMACFSLLMALVLQRTWKRSNWLVRVVLVAATLGLPIKVSYELASGATFFVNHVDSGFVPVPVAHVVGALAGLVAGLCPSSQVLLSLLKALGKRLPYCIRSAYVSADVR